MRVKLGSALIAAVVAVGMFSGTAAAQADWATCSTSMPACSSSQSGCCTATATSLNFASGTNASPSTNKALLIPMDRCHQPMTGYSTPGATGPGFCQGSPSDTSNGMVFAYGLIYRLMQMGIPVYWVVNPTKHASGPLGFGNAGNHTWIEDDIDMWILHSSQTSANIPTGTGTSLTACATATPCTGPVSLLDDNLAITSTYQYKEFPLRGTAFIIAGTDTDSDGTADRTEFNTFWQSYGDGNPASGVVCGASSNDCYDFTQVAIYEINTTAIPVWKNYITNTAYDGIPVAVKLDFKPPRVARVDSSGTVSNLFLQEANLKDPAASTCKQGVFERSPVGTMPYPPVVCDVSETELNNGSLVSGAFGWAWFDGSSFADCTKALQAIRVFLKGVPGVYKPGNIMVNDSTLSQVEQCANHQLLGRYGAAYSSSTGALNMGTTGGFNESANQPFTIPYPTNLFAQYGDLPMDFASSSVSFWDTGDMASSGSWGYNTQFVGTSTLKRLITREANAATRCGDNDADGDVASNAGVVDTGDKPHYNNVFPHASASCYTTADKEDGAAYGRFDNNVVNGVVFYLPGNNLSGSGARAELRMLLNSLIATPTTTNTPPPSCTQYEVSRSTPIVPLINGLEYIVQGSTLSSCSGSSVPVIEADAQADSWWFPYRVGHMRARLASATTTVLLDAGCNSTITGFTCPAGSTGIPTTRTIFTNTVGGDLRAVSGAKVAFTVANRDSVKTFIKGGANLLDTTVDTIITKVRAGYPDGSGGYIAALGGVDRSTVAVIQTSAVAGTSRPMMIYFGAADGMLHAVCAEANVTEGCLDEGHELWAFLPRKMLPHLRFNTQRIDGAPRVLDAYIDPDGAGSTYTTSWRTVLVFQTGMGDYTNAISTGREPAVYALDITDPDNPLLLWEYTDASAGASSLGIGLTMSAGPTVISGSTKYLAWAQTNNLGTDGPGTVVTAIDLASGAKWNQAAFIPSPNPRTSSNDAVVKHAIPGGTVPLDLPSGASGKITHLTFNDIWGRLYIISPNTLASANGSGPLFELGSDYYAMGAKPAVYESSGSQYAVFGTGGYHDANDTTWPLACCASANGTSCDSPQPTTRQVCSQYNSVSVIFPTQAVISVKLDTSVTSPIAQATACDTSASVDPTTGVNYGACNTGVLFRRDLGRDERTTSQALVSGTDIFLTSDIDNVNRAGYGTGGTNTGRLTTFAGGTGAQAAASTAIVLGAGGAFASNTAGTVYAGGGGGTYATGTTGTTGNNVTSSSTADATRKVWLRTE